MTTKLQLYGSLARALHYQRYRRSLVRRAELLNLGTISRWFPNVYEWWHS